MIRQTVRVAWVTTRTAEIELLVELFRTWDPDTGAGDVFYCQTFRNRVTVARGATEVQVFKKVSRAVADLASESQIGIGTLAQLGRDPDNRPDLFREYERRWRSKQTQPMF